MFRRIAILLCFLPILVGAQISEQCGDSTYKEDGYCPAVLSSPAAANIGETTVDITFSMDEGDGTNYACVTESATAPATGNLLVACVGGFAATPASSAGAGTQTASVDGLLGSTSYYGHAVNYSPNGWFSNIVTTAQFTTTTPTVPDQVTGFALGTPSSTSIPASWTAVDGAETYEIYTSGDVLQVDGLTTTSTTITGLTAETAYTFKVRARNSAGAGTFSATDTETTAATGSGADPYYSTNFDTGTMVEENGVSWAGARVPVNDGISYSGSYAIPFYYPATDAFTDSTREQGVTIAESSATAPTEVWFEYMWYVPANFEMRPVNFPDTAYNNKFFAVYSENYSTTGNPQAIVEYTKPSGNSSSITDTTARVRVTCMSGVGCNSNGTYSQPMITEAMRGTWVRVRMHFKIGDSETGATNVWVDDHLVYSNNSYTHYYSGGSNYWRKLKVMGWADTGFDEATTFYIDDFKIWSADPEWTF